MINAKIIETRYCNSLKCQILFTKCTNYFLNCKEKGGLSAFLMIACPLLFFGSNSRKINGEVIFAIGEVRFKIFTCVVMNT